MSNDDLFSEILRTSLNAETYTSERAAPERSARIHDEIERLIRQTFNEMQLIGVDLADAPSHVATMTMQPDGDALERLHKRDV